MSARLRDLPLELGAVAGPVLMTAAWLVLGAVSPGYTMWGVHVAPYSPIRQPISGLGLGPTGPFMNAAFIVSGVLMVLGAYGIFERIPELRARYICAPLMALPGFGSVIDGVFTFEHFLPHTSGFLLVLATVPGFSVTGFFLRRLPEWRALGAWLIAAGPITLALVILYFATFTPTIQGTQTGVAGLTERLAVTEIDAWYVVLGWTAFSKRNQSDRNPSQATALPRAEA
ncbi:MAG TPA: DUF998 domain-containing protein [Candidatus Dormibacteraeota bacterium]|nr:DUF998 domain-containing protein [Candidatus Dormibacteraeota bacterium]